jgi:hypothetical protein
MEGGAKLDNSLDPARSNNFFIKSGYTARRNPDYFTDQQWEEGVTWQPDVYPIAAEFAAQRACSRIIDLGCGRASKLELLHRQHPDWEFIGVDYGPNVAWCRANHRFGTWIEADLEDGVLRSENLSLEKSLLICSDVIEHLVDPISLLRLIHDLLSQGAVAVIFSTPERDLTRGESDNGPPENPCHVREWNLEEFKALLQWAGFHLIHFGLTRSRDDQPDEKTILAIAGLSG